MPPGKTLPPTGQVNPGHERDSSFMAPSTQIDSIYCRCLTLSISGIRLPETERKTFVVLTPPAVIEARAQYKLVWVGVFRDFVTYIHSRGKAIHVCTITAISVLAQCSRASCIIQGSFYPLSLTFFSWFFFFTWTCIDNSTYSLLLTPVKY